MRIIHKDLSVGEIKVEPQSVEDLWYLSKIVEPGDSVSGSSFRRFKTDVEKADSGEKKKVFLTLEVSAVEMAENANKLRITGKILSGTPEEFVQAGSFHTIDVEPRNHLTIKKEWTPYHFELLDEAKKSSRHVKALLVVLDDAKATVAMLRTTGLAFLCELSCSANKRNLERFEEEKKSFFAELLKTIESTEADSIVVAGPGFTRDDFKKYVSSKNPKLASRFLLEHCSNAEKSGVHELLKRGVLQELLGQQKLQAEFSALELLKKSLGKDDGMAVYGPDDVKRALEMSAVKKLLVSDELLRKNKEVQKLLESARSAKAEILLFNSEDDAGLEFTTFGVAALLHYNLNFSKK